MKRLIKFSKPCQEWSKEIEETEIWNSFNAHLLGSYASKQCLIYLVYINKWTDKNPIPHTLEFNEKYSLSMSIGLNVCKCIYVYMFMYVCVCVYSKSQGLLKGDKCNKKI